MTNKLSKLGSVVVFGSILGASVRAQEPPKGPVPLRLQVVISKYQGDKKISSLPYTVSVNSDRARASLRMGGQVPIVTTVTVGQGAEAKQQPSVQYRDVGTSIDVVAWAVEVAARGAGEILLTSMDRDGTQGGFDLALTRAVSDAVGVPVIASGGVGSLEHLAQGVSEGHADAVLAASVFHFGEFTVRQAKEHMRSRGIEVRL